MPLSFICFCFFFRYSMNNDRTDVEYVNNFQEPQSDFMFQPEPTQSKVVDDNVDYAFMYSVLGNLHEAQCPDNQHAPMGTHNSSSELQEVPFESTSTSQHKPAEPAASAGVSSSPQNGHTHEISQEHAVAPAHSLPQNVCDSTQLFVQPNSDTTNSISASECAPNSAVWCLLQKLITCSLCRNVFNRKPLCQNYLLTLNRPVQCPCGCVVCSLCYKEKHGCVIHDVVSYHGTVNSTAAELASAVFMDKGDQWKVRRNLEDAFKGPEHISPQVKALLNDTYQVNTDALKSGEFFYLFLKYILQIQ